MPRVRAEGLRSGELRGHGGRRCSGIWAGVLRHGNEQNEGGETEWSSQRVRRRSRWARGRHIGDGDRRCPRLKMMSMAAIRRVPGCLTRRGGIEGGGGALGHVRGARGRRWPQQQQAAATGSARAREGKRAEEEEERGGARGVPGRVREARGVVASPGTSRREATRQEVAKRGGGARHRAASCAGTGRRQACPLVVGLHSVGLSRWASVSAR